MRDPNRLKDIYDQMAVLHKARVPDMRIGQLMENFMGWYCQVTQRDPFYAEDAEWIELFRQFLANEREEADGRQHGKEEQNL